jgi:hypothetical protein
MTSTPPSSVCPCRSRPTLHNIFLPRLHDYDTSVACPPVTPKIERRQYPQSFFKSHELNSHLVSHLPNYLALKSWENQTR